MFFLRLGMEFSYALQEHPGGIAQAFLIAESCIRGDSTALVLGDNIFYGHQLPSMLKQSRKIESGAVIFGYEVKDPERYGVVSFYPDGSISGLVEKPIDPPSRYAVTGLYFYDDQVVNLARALKPSKRGELEITDLNSLYLEKGQLSLQKFERGFALLDTGTHDALLDASKFVQNNPRKTGLRSPASKKSLILKALLT